MAAVFTALHAFLCASALATSGYALHVSLSKGRDEDYEAMCDVSSQVSCSEVLTSRYGKGFGVVGDLLGDDHPLNINNSLFGLAFYTCVSLLGLLRSRTATLLVIAGELLGAANFVYLAYIMYFILHDLCLVCLSLYFIHSLLILLHIYHYCDMAHHEQKKKE